MNKDTMQRRQLLKGLFATTAVASTPLWAQSAKAYDVIVLGAGLSGLISAYQLQKFGANVLVLEARERLGGRIQTLTQFPSQPEVGGLQIGVGYGAMRTFAHELGLSFASLGNYARQTDFVLNGQHISGQAWPEHAANKLSEAEKKLKPSSLYLHYLNQGPQFDLPSDWTSQRYQGLDIPMLDYLKQQGASEQAIRLMQANLNATSLEGLSAADAFYRLSLAKSGGRGSHRIEGGNSRFTDALGSKLRGKIQVGKVVTEIADRDMEIAVHCDDGSRYRAKYCINTIPFSVLKNVKITSGLSTGKRQAIDNAQYTPVTQVHFALSSEVSSEEVPAVNLWSNHGFGRVFTQLDDQGRVQHLNSWINGLDAAKLDKMPSSEAIKAVKTSLETHYRPLKGKIEPIYHQSWSNEAFSRGAYIQFGPGQVTQFVQHMATPEGRMFFAGEHTEFEYSGMESAVVSGLRASHQLLSRL